MLASFIAALGGALYGVILTGFQASDFSLLLSISLLLYAVVGGVRSLSGPLIAGVLFGVVPQLLQGQSGASSSAVPDMFAGASVVAILAFRPDGLASLFRLPASPEPRARRAGRIRLGRFDAVVDIAGNGTVPREEQENARSAERP